MGNELTEIQEIFELLWGVFLLTLFFNLGRFFLTHIIWDQIYLTGLSIDLRFLGDLFF